MRKTTANAIKALLRMDSTVTREERMGIVYIIETGRGRGKAERDYSVADAAAELGLGRTTVWKMCKDGRVACDRRGKKFYIKATAIAELKREEPKH